MMYYTEKNNSLFVRAEGHITAQQCPEIKERIFTRLEKQPNITHLHVDLAMCTYMDSTFLGLLAGFNRKLKTISAETVEVQGANEECTALLEATGLYRIMSVNKTHTVFPDDMENMQTNKTISPEMLLEAHENLMNLSDENKTRFSTLHSILTQQITKK